MSTQAQHLVQTGAKITARDKRGCTTLHFAASHGQLDIVTYLWSKGAELDWETPGEVPFDLQTLPALFLQCQSPVDIVVLLR